MKQIIGKHIANFRRSSQLVKLNVGCGTDYKPGWINIDNNSDNNIGSSKLDLNWDLLKPLPYKDNSVDFIFNEHFLEHFTPDEALTVLQNLCRVLKPRGVIRVAVPDLAVVIDKYLNLPISEDPVIKKFSLNFIQTKAEWINISFRWWGHKWLYDAEELERRLKEAGFSRVSRQKLNQSRHPELRNLEIRDESLVVEGVKQV